MKKKIIIPVLIIASIFLVGCGKEDVKDDSSNKTETTQASSSDADVKADAKADVKEEVKDEKTEAKANSEEKNKDVTSNSKKETKDSKSTSKETENKSKEIFFGNWVIAKHVANDKVQAFSESDIKNMIGKTLSFSKEKATSFKDKASDLNKVVNNPIYKKRVISKKDFESSTREYVTFEKLGIKGDKVTEITANDSKNTCCSFYIKDNNTLILSGGGIYLQLNRK